MTAQSASVVAQPKLAHEDLTLFQGGKPIPIESFAQEPASIGILAVTSGSMEAKLPGARETIRAFVNDLNPQDDLFLFAFSSKPFMLQSFTADHSAVLRQLPLFYSQDQSALYDALVDALLIVRHGAYDRKALFVITDGFENGSKYTKEDVLTYAQRMNVPIYSIGIGEADSGQGGWFNPRREYYAVNTGTLRQLAKQTGVETYSVSIADDSEELERDVATMAAAFENLCAVGFPAIAGGNLLRLEIRNHPGLTVKVEGAPITVVNR